jgi:branched-chain amino acid transport system ATP-binding protein
VVVTAASVLTELRALSHNGRVARMVALGRAAATDKKTRALLDELARGEVFERRLVLKSCFTSRDGARVLAAVDEQVQREQVSRLSVMRQVHVYAREIVPAFNAYVYFRVGYWLAKTFARSVYRVRLGYADAQALSGVSLDVPEGEIVAIVGANGAGKTSLIRAIAGMLKPAAGRVSYKGADITGLDSHRVCNLGVGQVAEGRQVFPSLTVRENLQMGGLLPRSRARKAENMERMLDLFPRLRERLGQAAGTLSGGEQQMLAIARCLMGEPDLVMFDEPSLGLSPALAHAVLDTIVDLNKQGLSCLLVEQNVAASLEIASHACVLENGSITLSGAGADLLADDRVRQAYLGM